MDNNLEKLLDSLRPKLLRFCIYYLGNKTEAEDALQSVYLKVLTNEQKVREAENKEAYLYSIAKNVCRDQLRGFARLDQLIGIKVDLIFRQEAETPATFLHKLILLLPQKQKLVFILRIMLDKSERDTASILDITEGTVKSQLSRAMTFLKKKTKSFDNQKLQ